MSERLNRWIAVLVIALLMGTLTVSSDTDYSLKDLSSSIGLDREGLTEKFPEFHGEGSGEWYGYDDQLTLLGHKGHAAWRIQDGTVKSCMWKTDEYYVGLIDSLTDYYGTKPVRTRKNDYVWYYGEEMAVYNTNTMPATLWIGTKESFRKERGFLY